MNFTPISDSNSAIPLSLYFAFLRKVECNISLGSDDWSHSHLTCSEVTKLVNKAYIFRYIASGYMSDVVETTTIKKQVETTTSWKQENNSSARY